jgi:cytochrome c-type biogenesis protein CcmH
MTLALVLVLAAHAGDDPADIVGTIAAPPGAPADAVVFVAARPAGVLRGPPTWVLRLADGPFPRTFRIGPGNAMMGGDTPASLRLTARLDTDGDAATRDPADLEAVLDGVTPGTAGVNLALAASAPGGVGGPPPSATPPPAESDAPAGVVTGVDVAALLGAPNGGARTGEDLRAHTLEAARLLRCVVCQGLSVADSPSETARAMRDQAERLVARGYDTEQVLRWFEASYGDFVRLEPRAEGLNWLVWAGPLVLVVLGLGWIGGATRARPTGTPPAAEEDPLAPWLARVRTETRPTEPT